MLNDLHHDTNMTILTLEQRLFLEQQKIPMSRVFNASGMSKSRYQQEMGELGMAIAYGVSPCRDAGHTLRTRPGHCAQCNTARIAFVMRWDDQAEIYVAFSARMELTKIGVATNHQNRVETLNSHGYGGANDWSMVFHCQTSNAGKLEFMAHQSLNQHRVTRSYFRTGSTINCQELFDCTAAVAVEAVKHQLHLGENCA